MKGIYTLANDAVFDQLVALLNSIEVNYSKEIPVCVIPYDDKLDLVKTEIAKRPQVSLFEDRESIAKWEAFAEQVWRLHPRARALWEKMGVSGTYRMGMHRRFCAFDGPFERFVALDADTLIMGTLDVIFDRTGQYDLVGYDYQHKDFTHVYDPKSPKLYDVFAADRINTEILCAGFFASRRDMIADKERAQLIENLKKGDADILYPFGPDQTLLNYMFMKLRKPICNLALSIPREKRTGNSVTSTHFEAVDNVLYDKGERLTYLHYIGVPSLAFRKLCVGENIDFPYRDIFLHYRYLHEPEKHPTFKGKPKPYNARPGLLARIVQSAISIAKRA